MDAAGKDGTIRHVMSSINPQGCQVFSFKARSAADRRAHTRSAAGGRPDTRRHTHEPEDCSQRDTLARPLHGVQDPQLGLSVRQTRS
jgi:hypothetical protein